MESGSPAEDARKRSQERAERFQAATFRVAEAAGATESLQELFKQIHSIVGGLMEAANFYIALKGPAGDVLSFPYFVDEVDDPFPPKPLGRGLTEYVLRTGRPLLASPSVFDDLVAAGEVERIGGNSVDWLGVPLRRRERTIGVLAVQSYSGAVRYTEEDRDLLVFVSSLIAQSIERKRSEEALRESELKLRAIVSTLPDLILVLDREGRYLEIHANRSENLVQPREALLGHTIPEFLPAPIASLWLERIAACLLTGRPQALEYALDVQAGSRIFEARMVPYMPNAVMTVIRDVTDAFRSAEALDLAQSDLKRLTDNMIDVISQLDLLGRFQFVSPSHEIVTGWTSVELLGANALDLVHPDDRGMLAEKLERGAVTGKAGTVEYRYRARDGRYLWVETVSN
ncbi:MAG: PAS domain S-box protein, partial [Acidobacteriota bacterium]|nr:PAS domain S-box protein [Acidobacteriota bacterium]